MRSCWGSERESSCMHIHGGGEEHPTPGFAGRYLDARPKSERAKWWRNFSNALVEEQSKAGPGATALLKVSSVHLHEEIVLSDVL